MPARVPPPADNPQPIQFTAFTKEEFQSDAGIARLNLLLAQYTPVINRLLGASGPTLLPSGVDVRGATVTGLGPPQSESDAVSSGHANSKYGAAAVSPELDLGGGNTLKGLSNLYLLIGQSFTGKITLAKLTGGGANGSITVSGGWIVSVVEPT
jgi:hypothetical protein